MQSDNPTEHYAHRHGVGASGAARRVHHAREPLRDETQPRVVLHEALHELRGGLA